MKIITFDTLPNTNDYLANLSKKDANSWTVIYAKNQTEGKGYAGNQWQVNANENLTFSVLIRSNLTYKELIFLNQWVAFCIHSTLAEYVSGLAIKWPNDIILNDKKVCGVLIENFKHKDEMYSVIGIGINVNQTDFNHLPKATSLAIETDKTYDNVSILSNLVNIMEKIYYLIEEKKFEVISCNYNHYLYRKDQLSTFKINNILQQGTIVTSTNQGELVVEFNGEQRKFLHKQIELIF